MSDVNNVVMTGRLTKDCELRYTNGGRAVNEFSIACNRFYYSKNTEQTEKDTLFVDCLLWGRQGETLAEYLHKGQLVSIEGRLSVDEWKDKNDGSLRRKYFITCFQVNLLGPKQENEEQLVGSGMNDDVPL